MNKKQSGLDSAGKFFEIKPKNELVEVKNKLATLLVSTRLVNIQKAWEIVAMPNDEMIATINTYGKQISDKLLPVAYKLASLEH